MKNRLIETLMVSIIIGCMTFCLVGIVVEPFEPGSHYIAGWIAFGFVLIVRTLNDILENKNEEKS